jgi:ketosteroid isomerase-like protein
MGEVEETNANLISQGSNAVQREIERRYARYVELLSSKNIPAMMGMLTPDYVLECADGVVMDRDAVETLMKEQCSTLDHNSVLQITMANFHMEGERALVTITEQSVPLSSDAETQADHAQAVEYLQETWVFTGEAWKISRTVVLPVEAQRAA